MGTFNLNPTCKSEKNAYFHSFHALAYLAAFGQIKCFLNSVILCSVLGGGGGWWNTPQKKKRKNIQAIILQSIL